MSSSSKTRCDHSESEGFHDCYIIGVVSEDMTGHTAKIIVQCDLCGAQVEIVMHEIYRMSVEEFWEGNIIYEVNQYVWPDMPLEMLMVVLHMKDPETLKRNEVMLDKIRDENMILLHVVPVYGCEILALCKSIAVQSR